MPYSNEYFLSKNSVDIFAHNTSFFGGTEYMVTEFKKRVLEYLPKLKNYSCIVLPGKTPNPMLLAKMTKPIIIWMHNTIYQFDDNLVKFFFNPDITKKVQYIIVVSEFQKQETIKYLGIEESRVIVIPNAIVPLKYNPEKFDNPKKIKLINTSTAERGSYILLNSLSMVEHDFRLEMYNDFNPYDFPEYKKDPRVRFYGRTPKDTVIEAVEESHIHSYPSIYPETFCLSQTEAMSAGLLCLTSDIGSLPEVSKGYTRMYEYEDDWIKHAELYAKLLTEAIDDIKNGNWNPEEQINFVNSEYSWERHKERWLELHDML